MHYNLLVIGSGSAGMATARRAAHHSKNLKSELKIAVVERDICNLLGGTCVSRGCVPKKVMWSAANIADILHHVAPHYGFSYAGVAFDFSKLVKGREVYTARLRGIYEKNLKDSGIDLISGFAKFTGPHNIVVSSTDGPEVTADKHISADHIVLACGSKAVIPESIKGAREHCIDSDGFFRLEHMPESAVVLGGGYIGVELAGVLNSLGCKTTLCMRGDKPLRNFDSMLSEELALQMTQQGIEIVSGFGAEEVSIDSTSGIKTVHGADGRTCSGQVILAATGRDSSEYLSKMNIPEGMCDERMKQVIVDEYQNTRIKGIYAIGDVIGKAELTPVAIAAGRRLADRLFGGMSEAKISYGNIPSVVFSHPPLGTVGLTEKEAWERYDNVRVYTSGFTNSLYGVLPVDGPSKPKTRMKLICVGTDQRIVGLHVIGEGADEMLQGFSVAVIMGATKSDFDKCIALHPTAAEEFVTMAPWGLP